VVRAKGYITRYTHAKLFGAVGKKTDLLIRFSTVAGELGAADAKRDVCGFAIRFYTEEGNWELPALDGAIEILLVALARPSDHLRCLFVREVPVTLLHLKVKLHPEPLIRFIPKAECMAAVAVHESWAGRQAAVRHQGRDVVQALRTERPEVPHGSWAAQVRPRWKMFIQVMPESDAGKTPYNPFDLTKVWPHADYPVIEVGMVELNRNPDNYFAEIERAAVDTLLSLLYIVYIQ
jgi:catalase